MGTKILDAAEGTTQFNMTGLTSSTDTLSSSMTDKLQTMNVFNMAVNMAPLVAGVNIAASVDEKAWFLNPQTGVVNLAGLSVATTAIGAMNSSLTSLGAKLR
jgi:citrate lyase alpha subunit